MGKVLIVDDDSGIVSLLSRLVAKRNHSAITASDGQTALAQAKTEKPDLIFTDIQLPDISGEELIVQLKAEPELARTPIVVLSGNAVTLDTDNIPADVFLAKPFQLQTVYNILDNYLNKPRTADSSGSFGQANDYTNYADS